MVDDAIAVEKKGVDRVDELLELFQGAEDGWSHVAQSVTLETSAR